MIGRATHAGGKFAQLQLFRKKEFLERPWVWLTRNDGAFGKGTNGSACATGLGKIWDSGSPGFIGSQRGTRQISQTKDTRMADRERPIRAAGIYRIRK